MKRRNQKGLTLIELIVAFTVLLILTSMAVPLARARVRVERERELRAALREMYAAIDKYKDYCDAGVFRSGEAGHQLLARDARAVWSRASSSPIAPTARRSGSCARSRATLSPASTNGACAATRTIPKSTSWGGQNVFTVYSKTYEKAPDGKPYSEW